MDSKFCYSSKPLVSIVIPVYNGSNFLSDAIESALNQSYKNIEVLVVNDGSDDEGKTEEIIRKYSTHITSFTKPNGGVSSALNYAVKEMNGDFFSWLSHDDVYETDKIIKNYEKFLETENSNTIVYSDYSELFESTGTCYPVRLGQISPSQFRYWLLRFSRLHGCTLFIPKDAFEKCGTFDESLSTTQDYDLWFRMSKKFQFVHLNENLVRSRIHSNQDSNRASILALKECNKLYTLLGSELSIFDVTEGSGLDFETGYRHLIESFKARGWFDAASNLSVKF